MTSAEIEAALKDAREGLSINLRSGNAREAEVMLAVIGSLNAMLQEDTDKTAQSKFAIQLQEALGAVDGMGLLEMLNTVKLLREHWLEDQKTATCAKAGVKCLREES